MNDQKYSEYSNKKYKWTLRSKLERERERAVSLIMIFLNHNYRMVKRQKEMHMCLSAPVNSLLLSHIYQTVGDGQY
jgi:hypothetical protein